MKVVIFLFAMLVSVSAHAQQPQQLHNGRFQLVPTERDIYLLDTATGITWTSQYLKAYPEAKFWSPQTIFYNSDDEAAFIKAYVAAKEEKIARPKDALPKP